eukprot:Anaeramoba_ignava/c21107_g2_i2.p1 GENE.c21107_g2_i2~~c21107_g2_i2.p1  ORF type:complete len:707 (+),score=216.28 c21107_g2_i2:54-2174(+)
MEAEINEVINTSAKQGLKVRFDKYESCLHYSIKLENKTIRLSVFLYDYPSTRPSFWTEQEDSLSKSLVEKLNSAEKISKLIEFTNLLIEILKKDQKLPENEIEIKDNIQQKPQIEDEIGISDGESSDDSIHESHDLNEIESDEIKILKLDLEEAKTISGADQIKYIPKLFILRVSIDVSFLSPFYADALGIDETIPITIEFEFTQHYTSFGSIPIIELWQVKQKSFGLQFQLKEIIIAYLKKHWKHYGNIAKGIADEPNNQNIHLETTTQEKKKSGIMGHFFSKNKKKEKIDIDMKKVQSLVEMGFSEEAVVGVLIMTKNDASKASSLLIEGGHEDFIKIAHEYGFKSAQVKSKNSNKKFKRNFAVEVDIDTFIPSTNLIIDLFDYMNQRVKNCTNYCIVCGKKLGSEGLKPVCCEDPACIFRHQQMGLGANVSSEIEQQPDLVDLLITMAVTACYSSRNDLIFDPFPTDFLDPTTKAKKFDELKKVLDSFPSVDEMAKFGRDERKLRGYLESLHPESYRLLRWLITTNRAHLIKLEESQQITEFNTKNQFLLLSGPPQKESAFQELKKNNPSVYAFHGSPVENWHCILRTGLKNMSNTKRMMHAAAYGAGIYLAAEPSTSTYYGRSGTGWKKSRFSNSSFQCMALCEIVKTSEVKNPNPFYVIPNEDLVMTRCFFVNFGSVSSVNTTKLKEVVPTMFSSVSKTKK